MTSLYLELVSLHASERENELIKKKLKSLKLEANECLMLEISMLLSHKSYNEF
jgi:DNA polymerase III psi subunit